jgi:DNA recombination protein RmuC
LIEEGFRNRVVLASPTTLFALLKAVAYGWQQETLAENARKISELGTDVYHRLNIFIGHFAKIRDGLRRANEAFDSAVGSYERTVKPAASRFSALGVPEPKTKNEVEKLAMTPRRLEAPEAQTSTLDIEPTEET